MPCLRKTAIYRKTLHSSQKSDYIVLVKAELSFCTIAKEGNIIVLRYKEKHVDLDACHEFMAWCESTIPNQKYPMLNVLHPNNTFTEEAKKFSANEGVSYSISEAFVLNNGMLKIIGNFYLRFNRPKVPTRLFSGEEEARKWLNTFVPAQKQSV